MYQINIVINAYKLNIGKIHLLVILNQPFAVTVLTCIIWVLNALDSILYTFCLILFVAFISFKKDNKIIISTLKVTKSSCAYYFSKEALLQTLTWIFSTIPPHQGWLVLGLFCTYRFLPEFQVREHGYLTLYSYSFCTSSITREQTVLVLDQTRTPLALENTSLL